MSQFPSVPADRLTEQGWERIERSTDTLARLPVVDVTGYTLVYGDCDLRERIAAATGHDRPWRFFFATRLSLDPSPPGGGRTMLASLVRSRARDGFVDRLRDRGFESIDRAGTDRVRVRTGERAALTTYRARAAVDDVSYPTMGHLAVWHHDGAFRVSGGAYPANDLSDVLDMDLDSDPNAYREELLDLIRDVA